MRSLHRLDRRHSHLWTQILFDRKIESKSLHAGGILWCFGHLGGQYLRRAFPYQSTV
jgi:hypothetical protein